MDRIIGDRVARERAKYADYAETKAKAAKLDEIETANATETEKAVKAARSDGEKDAMSKANARVVRSEIKATAAALGFNDPDDAVHLFGDVSQVKVADDGAVDESAIKARLTEIAAAKKYLVKSAGAPNFEGGPRDSPTPKKGVTAGADMFASRRKSSTST